MQSPDFGGERIKRPQRSFRLLDAVHAQPRLQGAPRLIVSAKDMHYRTRMAARCSTAAAGLWCCNAGHCRRPIVQAIQAEAATLDYAPSFQFAHPKAFELATRLAALAPGDLDHVFFCNSGSEAVDTALKIALAYHNVRGQGSRTRLIGRERGYHGVGFGGDFGRRHRFQPQAFRHAAGRRRPSAARPMTARSRPSAAASRTGARILPTSSNVSSRCTMPPPSPPSSSSRWPARPACCHRRKAISQRLRAICDKHGILLIFDEVITGFGRLGFAFAAERYGVHARHDHLRQGRHLRLGADGRRHRARAGSMRPSCRGQSSRSNCSTATPIRRIRWPAPPGLPRSISIVMKACSSVHARWSRLGDAAMGLKDLPGVEDIRTIGLIAGIDLASKPDAVENAGWRRWNSAFSSTMSCSARSATPLRSRRR